MARSTRVRTTGILSLCLLLLGTFGATGALAGIAPPRAAAPHVAGTIIGTGSCGGFGACQNVTGPIGDNSCNGDSSCINWTGSIGDNSCDYESACEDGSASIGDNSCSGLGACAAATGSIGDYSCNGYTRCSVTDATIGDCMFNDVYPAVCVQPDARIRRVGRPRGYGNDIYNTDGINQTLTPVRTFGRQLRVVITVENDGVAPDSFTFGVSSSVPPTLAPVAEPTLTFYRGWPGKNITAEVMSGFFSTPKLAPGQIYRLRAVITPPNTTAFVASGGIKVHYLVTARSFDNPGLQDAVGLVVEVAATPLTLGVPHRQRERSTPVS